MAAMSDIYFYIHIPFCYRKCPYCSFVSFEKKLGLVDEYVNALLKEIRAFKTDNVVKTIYFGGGTPSVLKLNHVDDILNAIYKNFRCDLDEITFEILPVVKYEYMCSLKSLGINRLSIGVQSFSDKKLKILGRIHSVKDNLSTIKNARRAGFGNISIDLMYGVGESKDDFLMEFGFIKDLEVEHVSTYLLTLEKGSEFYKDGFRVSSDDDALFFYVSLCKNLEKLGFYQYEISNFSKKGFESRHNLSYWFLKEYKGFGVSASSFIDMVHFKNTDNLNAYMNSPIKNFIIEDKLKDVDFAKELFIFGLRKKMGVSLDYIRSASGVNFYELYKEKIKRFVDMGFLKFDGNIVSFSSPEAMFVSNAILNEFV